MEALTSTDPIASGFCEDAELCTLDHSLAHWAQLGFVAFFLIVFRVLFNKSSSRP